MVFKRIKSIENLPDGTKIHINNVKTLEEIVCHTVSEEFYHRHLRLFNKVRNPIKSNPDNKSFIINTLNGKYHKYKDMQVLEDALNENKEYKLTNIELVKPVKVFTGDTIIFQQYNSVRAFERKFVNNVIDYSSELNLKEHGLASVIGNNPYEGKFFEWDKTVYFIVDIKQTKWNKFKNKLMNILKYDYY